MSDPSADDRAIRDLVASYCHAIIMGDDDAWADTWAPDGEWQVLGRTAKGRDDALALYRKLVDGVPFVIQTADNGVIELDGDRARGRWLITERIQLPNGTPGVNYAVYFDEYARCDDGRWRFARRRFVPRYLGPPDLSAKPLPLPDDL